MAVAWYRKWRPKRFTDVVGQDHVVRSLQQALKRNLVSHAYLFCGPRGVGKTTAARLLAKSVNCLQLVDANSCGTCASCVAFESDSMMDCIEIDAASNRGIDDIRALRDTIHSAPILGVRKVYIIDEVHMLTKEAFNALLKTLEEPPHHVILILATTESGKIPDTIQSRCQRFDFRPLTTTVLADHIRNVAAAEQLKITDEGAEVLAEAATGSGRDALSLLQQVGLAGEPLSAEYISEALGFVPVQRIHAVLHEMRSSAEGTVKELQKCLASGAHPEQVIRSILRSLTRQVQNGDQAWAEGLPPDAMVEAADEWGWALRQLKGHPESFLVLASAALSTTHHWQEYKATMPAVVEAGGNHKRRHQPVTVVESAVEAPVIEQTKDTSSIDVSVTLRAEVWQPEQSEQELWNALVTKARPHNHSLAALLQDARLLGIEAGEIPTLMIGVTFPFHRARIQEMKNRRVLEDILQQLTGQAYQIRCSLITPSSENNKASTTVQSPARLLTDDERMNMAEQMFSGSNK